MVAEFEYLNQMPMSRHRSRFSDPQVIGAQHVSHAQVVARAWATPSP